VKQFRPHLWLVYVIGVIVPRRLRADWQSEWEAELRCREAMLEEWERLKLLTKIDLLRRSMGAFWDALWMQSYRWEDDMIQDIRFALRLMIKNPGFTFIAVLTLALGIGVNTAILSIVNGFLIRPLSVESSDELIVPYWGSKKDAEVLGGSCSYANYIDLRDQNKSLTGLFAWQMQAAGISTDESSDDNTRAELAWGEIVTSNYFDVLGVKPALGRGFLSEEDQTQNTHAVIVLSHKFWQQRFNSDRSILGKTVYLNGYPFTVIGVMSEGFKGVSFAVSQDFWVPLMMQSKFNGQTGWEADRGWSNLGLMGRLKSGVTMDQAEADLNLIAENLGKIYEKAIDSKVQCVSEVDGRFAGLASVFKLGSLLALSVAGLVLAVACANVANLMLARAVARSKEIGIRLAIGAGRFRIIRQLLTESIILALAGCALGWGLAYLGINLFYAAIPPFEVSIDLNVSPDLYVLKWMLVVSLLTATVFGLAPALIASRPNLVAVIKGDLAGFTQSGIRRRWNLRSLLVVTQIAISIIVLICAGLFLRSLTNTLNVDPGIRTESLVTMILDPGPFRYNNDTGKRFYSELLKRIESQPGVHSASLSQLRLMTNNYADRPLLKEGEPDPPPDQQLLIDYNIIAPNYFQTLGTELVSGRDFTERDTNDSPLVAIVNQEFARRFYGSEENATGKRIRFWNTGTPLIEIVGVAKDTLYRTMYDSPRPFIFVPQSQDYQSGMNLLIRANSTGDLRSVVETARREIEKLDSRVPVFGIKMGNQIMSFAYWGPRLAAGMATSFGLLALLLATMGLYSVMTYTVSQRTREVGIRMALGAEIRDVLKLIISQGMKLVLVGIVIGLVGAFAITQVLSSLLFGVSATDPFTFAGVAALLVTVAIVACWVPARRAARVDPLLALKHE